MTRDDIIRVAREAGFADGVVDIVGFEGFANFAALVAAHEREECAKVCEAGIKGYTRKLFDQIETKLREKNT